MASVIKKCAVEMVGVSMYAYPLRGDRLLRLSRPPERLRLLDLQRPLSLESDLSLRDNHSVSQARVTELGQLERGGHSRPETRHLHIC